MKKFYEQPVVEITVFDVENIMTASDVVNTADWTAEQKAAFESAVATRTDLGNTLTNTYSSAFQW